MDKDGDQITYILDDLGYMNQMKNGRAELSGEVRSKEVVFWQLYDEFLNGTGPESSLFIGSGTAIDAIKGSTILPENHLSFLLSGKARGLGDTDYEYIFSVGWRTLNGQLPNGRLHFMGSFNYSFYKLGNRTLTMVFDNKSRQSQYGVDFIRNYSRSEGAPVIHNANSNWVIGPKRDMKMTTTYQTYIFWQ